MSNTKIKAGQFSGIVGNGTDGYFLMTNGDGTMAWEAAGTPSPTITSVDYPGTATAADPAGGESVTINGTNFATGATVTIGGTTATPVSFVSATELTITTPAKAAGDYDIVVTNTDGGTATSVNGISYNGVPSWTTATGSLGTFASDTTISTITLQASEPDAGTITFSITNGALPTGLSLTGADIDGTTSIETADTTYSFTVTATDDENQATGRAFSITVEKYIVQAPENFEIVTYTGNGGTQNITGYIRKSAAFGSSTTSQITLPDSIDSDLTASVSFWFKLSEVQANGTFLFYFTRNGWGFNAYVAQDRTLILQACRQSNSTVISYTSSASYVVLGDWYHICITRSSNEAKYYINGSLVETDSYDGTRKTNNYPNSIGNFNSASYETRGVIDQFRVFNRALDETTDGEVTTLYNETYASSTKSTTDIFGDGSGVALYELDEDANSSNFKQAAVFDGSSSYVDTNLPSLTNTFSFSAWLYLDNFSTSYRWVFANWSSSSQDMYLTIDDDGIIDFNPDGNNGNRFFGNNFTINNWHHLVVTMDAGAYTVYLDNVSLGSGSTTNTTFNTGNNFQLGKAPNSSVNEWDGKMDDVRIYSDVLTTDEIGYLYNNTVSSIPTDNLTLHYKFDGNATDETGTYDGTENSITYSAGVYGGTPTNVDFLGMAFQPDLVWIKSRSNNYFNFLLDSVRGAGKEIYSNETNAEVTNPNISSFDTNGFTLTSRAGVNNNSSTYVAWCWKAGGTVSADNNSNGDITSTVSANPDAGFSIVKYTGDRSSGTNQTIGHGLSSAPELIIAKRLTGSMTSTNGYWAVYSSGLTSASYYLKLNETAAEFNDSAIWGGTTPTTDVFTVRDGAANNSTNEDHIAYCFHSVDGYQKIGSYSGLGSSAKTVYTTDDGTSSGTGGFEPRWIMIKRYDSTGGNWIIYDQFRDGTNDRQLYANTSDDESTTADVITYNSDGFTIAASGSGANALSSNYIYLAIA